MHRSSATVLLRHSSHYRADAFRAGLLKHGFVLEERPRRRPRPGDVLLIWNRRRGEEVWAQTYERAGGRVIVAENGYLPHPGPKGKGFALALSYHNGAGRWFVGDEPRFRIPEQPWRERGDHILLLPQRGIGPRGVAMPTGWIPGVKRRLERLTGRPIVVRPHPGASNPRVTLEDQLRGAHCAVTWGSGAGIKAIQAGVPVLHEMPRWIGEAGASRLATSVEACETPDRSRLWTLISWAQWSLDEIATGEAFDRLLNADDRDLLRTSQ